MTLRWYQQEAHDAAIGWVKKSRAPCVIEAATGAGKSHMIAAIADTIYAISKGKHVLCLAPSAELVTQNAEKFRATGAPCSIFSASAGAKSLRHPVVFGTPMTVANSIEKFDDRFAAVIIDEAHGITPTVREIITRMREANPNLRVIGLSATPYRMNSGYIFAQWEDGKPVPEGQTKEPYFGACIYRIRARQLIDEGFLTQPVIGDIGVDPYRTMNMELNSMGQFSADDVDRAFHGQGRKTADIIADVVVKSQDRKGVMIFAATVRHAKECMDSLPPGLSALVTADTSREERQKIIKAFKAKKIKYLVNVSVLTTGFDAPHVDVVALLRATESVGLLQQMVGRGLRIDGGKADCLILDYAENLERHCPDGDIFTPEIKVSAGSGGDSEGIDCVCPMCSAVNTFTARPNPDRYEIDNNGYFTDLDGNRIPSDWGNIPAHYGRRCRGLHLFAGNLEQCEYRWTSKECPHCKAENDISARYCISCKGEIVDPNEKLRIAFKAMKKDPTQRQTDRVIAWAMADTVAQSGRPMIRIDVQTEYRAFSFWVQKAPSNYYAQKDKEMLDNLKGEWPNTITYQKEADSKFYRVYGYNRKADEAP